MVAEGQELGGVREGCVERVWGPEVYPGSVECHTHKGQPVGGRQLLLYLFLQWRRGRSLPYARASKTTPPEALVPIPGLGSLISPTSADFRLQHGLS